MTSLPFYLSCWCAQSDSLHIEGSLQFVKNCGQWQDNVLYKTPLFNGAIFFEPSCMTFHFFEAPFLQNHTSPNLQSKNDYFVQFSSYKVHFLSSNPDVNVHSYNPYPFYYNFFIGKRRDNWASRVPLFSEIRYINLYNGINLHLSQQNGHLKYEFVVEPYANPDQISLLYEGVKSMTLKREKLFVQTSLGTVVEMPPVAYQVLNENDTVYISCRYFLSGNKISYKISSYDPSLPLIIDPVVVFSSFSGSTADNWGYTSTFDSQGNLYGGGITFGVGYPTTIGAYQEDYCTGPSVLYTDVTISKFNATGSSLLYATYLGGSRLDIPHSLVVSDNNELYVMGTTGSNDFPVTSNAFDTVFHGGVNVTLSTSLPFLYGSDIFVSRFSEDGSQLLSSTFVGGSANDGLNFSSDLRKNYADENRGEIILDDNNNVYVVSSTSSADFPVTARSFDPSYNGMQDACVFKMNYNLTQMIWSTFLGGSKNDAGYSISVASDNSVYVCGGTVSSDFPVTSNAYQPQLAGNADGFVAHISENGHVLKHCTYLGRSGYDQSFLVKTDKFDHPHLFGQTDAAGASWIQNVSYYVPGGGQFLVKMSPDLDGIRWMTAFGTGNGGPDISPTALMVDYCRNIYMSGWGSQELNGFGGTSGLPVTGDAFQSYTDGQDFYFICISEDASQLKYGSFFGGTTLQSSREHVDGGTSRFDRKGRIYQAVCAGCGGTNDFPTTNGAWSQTNGSSNCNLGVIKMDFALPEVVADFSSPRTICYPDRVHFVNNSQTISTGSQYFWDFGDGSSSTAESPSHSYQTSGVYQVTLVVRDAGSCNFSDTLTKSILVLTNHQATLPELSVCSGEFVQIGLPPFAGTDFEWQPNPDIADVHVSNPIVSPTSDADYCLIMTSGSCVDTFRQHVTVFPIPALLMNDTAVCKGDTAMLYVVPVVTGASLSVEWSYNPQFTDVFARNVLQVPVSPENTSTYYVRVNDPHCSVERAVTIGISEITIQQNPDFLICFEDGLTLQVQHDGGPDCSYSWSLDDGTTYEGETPYVSPSATTGYSVTVTNAMGCKAVGYGRLVKRTGTFPETLSAWCEICSIKQLDTTEVFATDYGADYTYQWTPSDNALSPNNASTWVWPLLDTEYMVSVTDTFGCTQNAAVKIDVEKITCSDPYVFIPNTFSPNGDGVNDKLFVRSGILDRFTFKVYSHWGQKVFETNDLNDGWDGTFKGAPCQNGVYDYHFQGICVGGDEIEVSGNVMLVR